jgi:hypothetical protein
MLHISLQTPVFFYKETNVHAAVDKFVVTVVEAIDMVLPTGNIKTSILVFQAFKNFIRKV